MTYFHGSKIIIGSILILFLSITTLMGIKINEKKIELKRSVKEYEIVSSKINQLNQKTLEGKKS